jgi:ligand-binding SRPBCC domain-containing protein
MAAFELTTLLQASPEQAFDISLDVEAHTSSMRRERIVGGVRSGRLKLGDTVTFAARHFGVPWRMTSRIVEYERPAGFVDEQVRGPFRSWRHEHTFTWDESRQVTVARDDIRFASPLGPLGRLVDKVVLRRYMRRIVLERNAYLARTFEEPG